MGGAVLTLFFAPWLDTSMTRSNRFRPLMKWFFWRLVIATLLFGYCGARPVDAMAGGMPTVWVARLATLYYFASFWLVVPVVGLVEVPDELPASIVQSMRADRADTPPSRWLVKTLSDAIKALIARPSAILARATSRRRHR